MIPNDTPGKKSQLLINPSTSNWDKEPLLTQLVLNIYLE